jgi:hypothetical protein
MDVLSYFKGLPSSVTILAQAVAIAGLTYFIYQKISSKIRDNKRKAYPKDVVILHQFPRGPRAPSASPFPIKLETWLRMAGIKYQVKN